MPLMQSRSRGFTLIEVLIALLILAIGLLGMVSLMMTSLQSNQNAYQRGQASLIAYDMADRLRLNRTLASGADDYLFDLTSTPPSDPGCKTTGCTTANIADIDLREWQENFQDVNGVGQDGDAYVAVLPGGAGTVQRNGRRYLITVSWTPSVNARETESDGSYACNGVVDDATDTVIAGTPDSAANARCFFQLRVDL
ncbi:type IV pilus modification protein PilV [Metapseudomonas resinovorans]|uniref:Putative type 4 pili modification protein PilV n=1 Tax=Metapseudomonas resinovorans NBRC 106553 TaxID=1245471 RepID=S6AFP1_METRE|nr:type IV pilus modification protein PilV [Pseudomonas resinovorans]BAN46670.1 putative type 4 pili modification protein PilV [Pseudomonas resinovorans NBRC 106553]